MTEVLMVFLTASGREEAERIATDVVAGKLAACVNVVPAVRSCYVWEGKLTWSEEVLLIVKTTRDRILDPVLLGFEHLEDGWLIAAARLRPSAEGGWMADGRKAASLRSCSSPRCSAAVTRPSSV